MIIDRHSRKALRPFINDHRESWESDKAEIEEARKAREEREAALPKDPKEAIAALHKLMAMKMQRDSIYDDMLAHAEARSWAILAIAEDRLTIEEAGPEGRAVAFMAAELAELIQKITSNIQEARSIARNVIVDENGWVSQEYRDLWQD